MRAFPLGLFSSAFRLALVGALVAAVALTALGQAQSNAADLRGFVRDPQGAVVPGATVTARNTATNLTRTATTNDEGLYQITNLPPGDYEVTVESATFKRAVAPTVTLTVGQRADLDVTLEVGAIGETVTVTGATTEVVETSRTAVATTIDQQRLENLPINERNYINFALTTSQVTRDNARPIGPAPTSGLNFGGQRGRSNLVQVDGADNTDNSVNAARTTVSQEAVQEFQVVTNSYAPEFGRTSGGVVNVVTKSGTNEVRGNVFGFIRHKSIQARNAFAPVIDNDPGKKPPFTRAQYGATLGGPLNRDQTFFFAAHEQRRRQESGFFTSDVRAGLNGSVTVGAPFLPFSQTFNNITTQQANYVSGLLQTAGTLIGSGTPGNIALGQQLAGAAVQYAALASSGGNTALFGTNPLRSVGGAIPAGTVIGPRFFLSGAPVPQTFNATGQPIAFRPLSQLPAVFPLSDDTMFNSLRIDHMINSSHQFTMRGGYNTSDLSGIQVESQNQSLGQNDFSRTGVQTLRDGSFVATLASTLSNTVVNEGRFSFSSRRATFRSQNGEAVAVNIAGTAFFGRELFSPVIRTENRYQFTDNINVVAGNHTLKFGADANFVSVDALFELNFAGLFNFGGLTATTLAAFPVVGPAGLLPNVDCQTPTQTACVPQFTPVQQYGIGFPTNFIQGFGNPTSRLKNRPFGLFAQDSWKARRNLTLNYGVRYDIELTDQIEPVGFRDPLSGINLSAADITAAQNAIGVRQGFPRDKNNIAPRAGLAWDITGDGRTVVRASFGLFYDHPLLAIGFNSDIADAAQQQQGVFISGSPAPTALLNATQVFQGTVCTGQGSPVCAALPAGFRTPGVAAGSDYQFGRQRFNDQTFPGFGPVLPFTLPVSQDFEYAYANQGNLTLERQLTKNMSVSASYLFVGAHHLPHPLDINAPRVDLQVANFQRFAGRLPSNTTEVALVNVFPTTGAGSTPGSTFTVNNCVGGTLVGGVCSGGTPTTETFVTVIPGLIVQGPRGRVISPAAANFFRPNAPNYFLVQALTGLTPAAFNTFLAGTLRTPGTVSPFGSVNAQVSDGNSVYHAGSFELKKRFSNNFQFLASYTLSHSIDDSSDLQTLLLPQDNRNFRAERADSLFDQRHRFVFSGVIASPGSWRSGDGMRRFLSDFVVAPIVELSSGRPFNILTGVDTNNDQSNQTDRPNVAADGTLVIPPAFSSGALGRNMGITRSYMSVDMRLTRKIRFGERFNLDVIAEGFNLLNRFNEAAASPLFTDVNIVGQRQGNKYLSRSTAAFDPRQFQFGLKLNF
ncbi:MAG TPA: TonB-dependent receptor [Pyrinomonadaceae bacterium]|nr:TonB-dependent receptor [Pyrinomonadaceae bacterium]